MTKRKLVPPAVKTSTSYEQWKRDLEGVKECLEGSRPPKPKGRIPAEWKEEIEKEIELDDDEPEYEEVTYDEGGNQVDEEGRPIDHFPTVEINGETGEEVF